MGLESCSLRLGFELEAAVPRGPEPSTVGLAVRSAVPFVLTVRLTPPQRDRSDGTADEQLNLYLHAVKP